MNRILYIITACCLLFIVSCQKEIGFLKTTTITDAVIITVQGNVVDDNGNPSQGVTITAGSKTAVTDARGYFRIRNASLEKSASLITAEKPGYFKAFRIFSVSGAVDQVKIKLLKKILSGSVNSSTASMVTLANGSTITFAANSFSKASGGAYSGTVNVYATYIDPTLNDIGETVPGSFLADDKENKRVILSSYGMMAVELESSAGEKLQITTGNVAKLNFSIPAGLQSSAPDKIALWYVDEKTGLWKEEGRAVKNGNTYSGDVKHFTYWNCDVSGPAINLTATFVNQNGQPLIYTDVSIKPVGGYSSAHGFTDSLGQINGPAPANKDLILEVRAPAPCYNIIYSQNIGPYSSNTNLGTIAINNTQSLITIQGKLMNCSGNNVTHGFAEIVFNNMVRYAAANSSGNFSITFTTCGSAQSTCVITGVDSLAQQQGSPTIVTITQPVTNAGNVTACGTSTLEFVNYTVDGNPVNLSSTTAGDSFHGVDTVATNRQLVFLQGYRSQNENLSLDFYCNGLTGTFPISYLSVNNLSVNPIAPSNITITKFAQPGEYFEGNFSAQFKDLQNVAHNLNGTLRVKRRL